MAREIDYHYTDSPTSEIVFYHNSLVGKPPQEFGWSDATRRALRRAYDAIDRGDLQTFLQLHEDVGITPRRSRIEEFAVAALLEGKVDEAVRAYAAVSAIEVADDVVTAARRAAAVGDTRTLEKLRRYFTA